MNRRTKTTLIGSTALLMGALTMTGCGIGEDHFDTAESKSADTGAQAVSSGLAPSWLPADAKDVKVQQRTTGDERLLVADGDLELPGSCRAVATTGKPSKAELAASYRGDAKTKGEKLSDLTTAPLLTADWWPQGQEKRTTTLCGRWWVSSSKGKIYAFAPERKAVAEQVTAERG